MSRRKIKTIQDVVDWGLCTGCGACVAACTHGAVSLVNFASVGIRPVFAAETCANCTDCLAVCPGYQVDAGLRNGDLPSLNEADHEFGPALEIWEGYAADPQIRYKASSGGLLTALALYCLEQRQMEFVLHAGMDEEKPWLNRTVQSRNREQLVARTGSRYAPASPCEGLRDVLQAERPCVFIGKPCDAAAAAMACRQDPQLHRKLGVIISFFCAGAPSTQGTLDLLEALEIKPEELAELRYRGEGWPGGFKVTRKGAARGEGKPFIPYAESWDRLNRYRPFRCHLCPDGLGRLADISCGDAWHCYDGDGDTGRSILLVRTERGRQIVHGALEAGYIVLAPLAAAKVFEAQTNLLDKRRQLFGRLFAMRLLGVPIPRFLGFSLLRGWLQLPLKWKLRTILGTLRRVLQRGLWRPRPPLPFDVVPPSRRPLQHPSTQVDD